MPTLPKWWPTKITETAPSLYMNLASKDAGSWCKPRGCHEHATYPRTLNYKYLGAWAISENLVRMNDTLQFSKSRLRSDLKQRLDPNAKVRTLCQSFIIWFKTRLPYKRISRWLMHIWGRCSKKSATYMKRQLQATVTLAGYMGDQEYLMSPGCGARMWLRPLSPAWIRNQNSQK